MDRQEKIQLNTFGVMMVLLISIMFIAVSPISTRAESLENIINMEQQKTENNDYVEPPEIRNSDYVEYIKGASNLSEPNKVAIRINDITGKVASFIVTILAYFITAFLAVRVLLDLCYVAIPFTRSFLCNGYQGNVQNSGGMVGQPSMIGGTGQAGVSNGNVPIQGNTPMRGNILPQGNPPMQAQVTPASGRIQLISNEALNAVASETVTNPGVKANSAIKTYIKSATNLLVATALMIVFTVSGALTGLGFLLGEIISKGINSIGNML